jgi:hypothetical protein
LYSSDLPQSTSNTTLDAYSPTLNTLETFEISDVQMGTGLEAQIASMKDEIKVAFQHLGEEFRRQMQEQGTQYDAKIDTLVKEWQDENCLQQPLPRIAVAAESSRLFRIASTGKNMAVVFGILRSLRFPTMEFRHSKIAESHPDTFKWMYSTEFVQWLESNESIYWVSGKPGSGKSTLIKFLADNSETTAHLTKWVGSDHLITASFYFWFAGTEKQKSQEGLLQSLLFEILRKNSHLISEAFPSRWKEFGAESSDLDWLSWTRKDLLDAFTRLKQYNTVSTKFFFFIDGLDEYDGHHADLIDVLKGLVDSSNVKLCLSSRPWNVFEAAFGKNTLRKLYLQDLNRPDIEVYVRERLERRDDFQRLRAQNRQCEELVEELVDKAQGVFLWVFLVVRSLIDGLENYDRIFDLLRRLRAFPSDLEAFFKHIFTSLDPIYQVQTARAFQVALAASEPLSLLNYWYLDREEEHPNFAMEMAIQSLTPAERENRNMEMQKRLNGRCKGLLEATNGTRLHCDFIVDFLHRTVKDFLHTKDMQVMLSAWRPPNFNPNLTICRTILAEIKSSSISADLLLVSAPLDELVEKFIYHAREFEHGSGSAPVDLIDELEIAVARYSRKTGNVGWSKWGVQKWADNAHCPTLFNAHRPTLLEYAIGKGLALYAQAKFERATVRGDITSILKEDGSDYLLLSALQAERNSANLVKLLLNYNANPLPKGVDENLLRNGWRKVVDTLSIEDMRFIQTRIYDRLQVLMVRDMKNRRYIGNTDILDLILPSSQAVELQALLPPTSRPRANLRPDEPPVPDTASQSSTSSQVSQLSALAEPAFVSPPSNLADVRNFVWVEQTSTEQLPSYPPPPKLTKVRLLKNSVRRLFGREPKA